MMISNYSGGATIPSMSNLMNLNQMGSNIKLNKMNDSVDLSRINEDESIDQIGGQSKFPTAMDFNKSSIQKHKTLGQSGNFSKGRHTSTEYKRIPNYFKNMNSSSYFCQSQIQYQRDSGLAGIYNMGNTCFINTGTFSF